jgi:hypothetical protein
MAGWYLMPHNYHLALHSDEGRERGDLRAHLLHDATLWQAFQVQQQNVCYKFIAACSAYNKGKMAHDEVFEALKLVYRTEQATCTWADLMPSKFEITMLTTNLANANIKLHKMKLLGGGGSRGSGGGRGGRGGRGGCTKRGNGNHWAWKGSGGTNDEDHEWMLTRTTGTIKHPVEGYDMKLVQVVWTGPFQGDPRRHVHAGTPQSCEMAPIQEGVTGEIQCQNEIPKSHKI